MSTLASEKPVNSISKSRSKRLCNSIASNSRSQPALSASFLSAITCAPLRLAEVRQARGWNSLDPEKLRCGDASMPSDDLAVVGNQHRIVETKALDRRRDLLDLSLAMTSRVSRIGL